MFIFLFLLSPTTIISKSTKNFISKITRATTRSEAYFFSAPIIALHDKGKRENTARKGGQSSPMV